MIASLAAVVIVAWQPASSPDSSGQRERMLRALVAQGLALTDDRTAIPICFGPTKGIFPREWAVPPHNAKASQLLPSERQRAVAAVKSAMRKYPPALLEANLAAVHVVRSLEFDGIDAGGTNSADEVYIADDGVGKGYTDRRLEETLHHEFSSILLRNHARLFQEAEWLNANPVGFQYGESGVDSIKEGRASEQPVPEQHEQGFLHEYARGDIEDDFNSFAEALFMNAPGFWQAVDAFDRVRRKARLAIEFYHDLDSSFTETGFRKLR